MTLQLAIQIANALAMALQTGVPLIKQVENLLHASDEPEAKAALAQLRAVYESTGAEADAALGSVSKPEN